MKDCIRAGIPCFVWGSPGIGKSDIIRQVAAEEGVDLIDWRAPLHDPTDLMGIPHVEGDTCKWTVPDFLPRSGKGIFFMDEFPNAVPLMQVACLQLVLDRRIGNYKLPDGWVVVAAGNRDTDRAYVNRLSTAQGSRFAHVQKIEVNLECWVEWALGHNIRPEVIAFLRWRPDLLNAFDPSRNDNAYPCPRTWAMLSKLLDQAPAPDYEFEAISGIVGEGAATEFLGFLRIYRDLPDIDNIIANPTTSDVPKDVNVLYALCGALSRKVTAQNAQAALAYAGRLQGEFSVLLVKDIVRLQPDLLKSKAFITWGLEHQDILL